jgi:hypothetical protein
MGRSVGNDANMQYPPLHDIWIVCSYWAIIEDMCNLVLTIKTLMLNVGLTFKP